MIYILDIQWSELLLGEEHWDFLIETVIRTIVMFIIILVTLRMLGKRGVDQLSVFELGVIIGLGSAAGDPMFYKDVGLLVGMIVFIVVIALYKLVTFLINRSDRFEEFVEGKPVYLIMDGQFLYDNFKKEPLAREELFMQLRLKNVSHLGQVCQAIIETNGNVSILYYSNDQVRPGLPIFPHLLKHTTKEIREEGHYACVYCARVIKNQTASAITNCDNCQNNEWVEAIETRRIT